MFRVCKENTLSAKSQQTPIRLAVSLATQKELQELGKLGERYEDVIIRLIEKQKEYAR